MKMLKLLCLSTLLLAPVLQAAQLENRGEIDTTKMVFFCGVAGSHYSVKDNKTTVFLAKQCCCSGSCDGDCQDCDCDHGSGPVTGRDLSALHHGKWIVVHFDMNDKSDHGLYQTILHMPHHSKGYLQLEGNTVASAGFFATCQHCNHGPTGKN